MAVYASLIRTNKGPNDPSPHMVHAAPARRNMEGENMARREADDGRAGGGRRITGSGSAAFPETSYWLVAANETTAIKIILIIVNFVGR